MVSLKAKQFHPEVVDVALRALKDVKIDITTQLPESSTEKARFAYFFKDPLTKVYNDNYLNIILSSENETFKRIHYVELHHISQYNNTKGWQEGNLLIRNIAQVLHEINHEYMIFRIHGDDFFILSQDADIIDIDNINSIDCIKESGVTLSVKSEDFKNVNACTLEDLESYFKL